MWIEQEQSNFSLLQSLFKNVNTKPNIPQNLLRYALETIEAVASGRLAEVEQSEELQLAFPFQEMNLRSQKTTKRINIIKFE